jgi:hypothetical protein
MMTSYFGIIPGLPAYTSRSRPAPDALVYLGLTVIPLQVDLFLNALLSEDVMTAAYTLIESEAPQ